MSWFSPGPRKRGPASKVSRVGRRLLRRTRNTSKALGLHRDLMRHWITSFQLLNRNPTSQRFAKSGKGFQRAPLRGIIAAGRPRSEEHTSELQSLMRISYAVFGLKKKNKANKIETHP